MEFRETLDSENENTFWIDHAAGARYPSLLQKAPPFRIMYESP